VYARRMTRAAIKHAEEALRNAMLRGDVAALDDLIDDELVFVGPSGAVASKEDDLTAYRSGDQTISSHQPRDLTITLHGDDLAVSTVVVALEGVVKDRRFAGTYRYLRTWRRNHDGAWRIISGAVVAVPDA
jgi:ketosteroid isomerase-like protein